MSYKRSIKLFSILLLLFALGCDLAKNENYDEEIKTFVKSQSLPDAQRPVLVLRVSDKNFKAFRVSFGPARDCPSGCFFTQAIGIKYNDRIGWMAVHNDSLYNGKLAFFDVRSGDDYLFSQDVRNRFQKVVEDAEDGSWNPQVYKAYLKMLARDTDTPSATLLNIAELLYTEYHPGVAVTLLKNPLVKKDREILETLAELPSFNRSEFYKEVREQARVFLDQLEE